MLGISQSQLVLVISQTFWYVHVLNKGLNSPLKPGENDFCIYFLDDLTDLWQLLVSWDYPYFDVLCLWVEANTYDVHAWAIGPFSTTWWREVLGWFIHRLWVLPLVCCKDVNSLFLRSDIRRFWVKQRFEPHLLFILLDIILLWLTFLLSFLGPISLFLVVNGVVCCIVC